MTSKHDPEFVRAVQELAYSDAVENILDGLIAKYTAGWKDTRPDDPCHREHCWRMVKAVEALKNEIRAIATAERIDNHNSRLRGRTPRSII